MYYSRALDPPATTVDPLQAHQAAYYNVKHGIMAVCMVFLGKLLTYLIMMQHSTFILITNGRPVSQPHVALMLSGIPT